MPKKPRNSAARRRSRPRPTRRVLDRVRNPHPDTDYVARFTSPEFTVTLPGHRASRISPLSSSTTCRARWLVELKSLKLYLEQLPQSRRLPRGLHGRDRQEARGAAQAEWLRIGGYFHPRGGMPIDVFWQAGKLPAGIWVPDQGVQHLSRPRRIASEPVERGQ